MDIEITVSTLEKLIYEYKIEYDGFIDSDYVRYVNNIIRALKEEEKEYVCFTLPDWVSTEGWVVYTNTGEELTANEAIKRDVEKELG